MRVAVRVAGLCAAWVALWGDVSAANVAWGVLVGAFLAWLVPSGRGATPSAGIVRPAAALRLVVHVAGSLVVSSIAVMQAVLRPTPTRLATEVVAVPLRTRSRTVAAVVSNAITMTPGTLTLSADPDSFELRVHVLGSIDAGEFAGRIAQLESLVEAAFGPRTPR